MFDGKWYDGRYIETRPPLARFAEPDVSIEKAEADLAAREARVSELEAKLAAERVEIEQIKIYLRLSQRYGGGVGSYLPAQQLNHLSNGSDRQISQKDPPLADELLSEACRGKSIADAAIALIRLAGRPLSEEEIVDQLRRGKVTIVSETPALNLRFALLRKRKETGAIKLTEDKKHWELGDNAHSENGAHKRSAFFENRQRNNHAERSRQGLLAARERGAKGGRKPSYTDEQIREAMAARAAGARWKEIASPIGISVTRLQARIRELQQRDDRTANPDT